jgi:transcription elongation factor GreA
MKEGMNQAPFYITEEGAQNLRQELAELRGPKRSALAKRLRAAIKQGDLSENADYIAAKEDQAFLEGRIQELETVLRDAEIIDHNELSDEVKIGSTVLVAEDGREPQRYIVVGVKEADPRGGKISYESPIGQALMGKRAGDTALAKTPAGTLVFQILDIQ